jgi:hypothetical protein
MSQTLVERSALSCALFRETLEEVEAEVGRPIVLTAGRGRQVNEAALTVIEQRDATTGVQSPYEVPENALFLHFWTTLSHGGRYTNMELYGDFVRQDERDNGAEYVMLEDTIDWRAGRGANFELAPDAFSLHTADVDWPLGEVIPNHVLLRFHYTYTSPRKLDWRWMLHDVLVQSAAENFTEVREEARQKHDRETFLTHVKGRNLGEVDRLRTEIGQLEQQFIQYTANAANARTRAAGHQTVIDGALRRADHDYDDDELMATWEGLNRHVNITDAHWNGNVLNVHTTPITLTHPADGRSAELGPFEISLDFNGNNGGYPRIHNTANRRGGYDHPHVQNGQFCGGSLTDTLHRMAQERKIAELVAFTIDLLGSINPDDDWARRAEWWFGAADAPAEQGDTNTPAPTRELALDFNEDGALLDENGNNVENEDGNFIYDGDYNADDMRQMLQDWYDNGYGD